MRDHSITSLVLFLIILAEPALADVGTACTPTGVLTADEVLIGYIGNVRHAADGSVMTPLGRFRTLGILRGGKLIESNGTAIHDGMQFWPALDPSAAPTKLREVSAMVDRLGVDRCVYHGETDQDLASWTLLASRNLPGAFRHPTESDRTYFARQHDPCVAQGDHEPARRPPCARPQLLAVSDIDRDGRDEYWATEPYRWDTGISVWQRNDEGLVRVFAVCSGCSD